jgi:outer membrane protein OmpA-like peptidoglycan-associated protein
MERTKKLSVTIWLFLLTFPLLAAAQPASSKDCQKAERYYQQAMTDFASPRDCRYALEQAVKLCPANLLYRIKLAENLRQIAGGYGRKIQDKDPKVVGEGWNLYNQALSESAEQYEKALQADPKAFDALIGLARVYFLQNRLEMAADLYKRALKGRPADEKASAGLATVQKQIAASGSGDKPVKAQDIVKHAKLAPPTAKELRTMGFEQHAVVTEVIKDRQTFNHILFDEWSFDLNRPEAIQQLMEIGKALSDPQLARCRVVVEGHTDDRGGFDRNMTLSWDRATVVKQFLIGEFHVNPARIIEQGFGYTRPRVPNDTEAHMLLNRRVELIFIE